MNPIIAAVVSGMSIEALKWVLSNNTDTLDKAKKRLAKEEEKASKMVDKARSRYLKVADETAKTSGVVADALSAKNTNITYIERGSL